MPNVRVNPLAELNRRITETDQRLNRLYNAIEAGLVDLSDAALKERMSGLKAIRDQATADAERLQLTLDSAGNQAVTPEMVADFSSAARDGLRMEGAAIGGITCAPSLSASRSLIPKFVSWDRNQNCCERFWPLLWGTMSFWTQGHEAEMGPNQLI